MKYRKKPVTVEAVQFTGSTTQVIALETWIEGGEYVAPGMRTADMRSFYIPTLEGDMRVQPGDYVIKGVQGEFYPCKSAIFEATYEKVTDDESV